ncbi:hypothetical protein CkaCkLH20_06733 [Colletotrichum karsti]|uniref:Abscission/NoCut checkpoint regulator n=1 Tax=Colletotrichum karsti TaxID=1095194 RepID=A0A9P6I650_9PEZI|nr:uncharacterized protein CkaCkLH20_06733 [Colletotrichum karsti]KAF9875801.1 hypothetical protein CkaCkLH20_06733 [Colletotrichum karsti]
MSGPDKSLLSRLSALKGGSSGVSLDRSSNALNVSLTGIEPAKPPSREDALAARLRSLRNTPEREEPPKAPAPPQQSQSQTSKVLGQQAGDHGATASLSSPVIPSSGPHPAAAATIAPPQSQATPSTTAPSSVPTTEDDVDPLLQTDDQTLEDLLSGEDLDPQDWGFDPSAESAKVNALLEELSKASPAPHAPEERSPPTGGQKPNRSRDEDDSEGEEMSRDVETLLSQALDEAKLNSQSEESPDPPPALTNSRRSQEDESGGGDPGFSLPSVPSTITAPKSSGDDAGGLPDLSLPSVPSGAPKHTADSDFDNDIAARMAALSGLGAPSEGGMGLPSVPTFQPADRAVKRLTSKTGYTDEDAETWCTVCLEDATLQCLGCEDVYCARCWHEMHVGPAAAFDDRTHKAVHFVKPKKEQKRRVALGAS